MPKKIEEKIHILSPSRGYLAAANVMGPIVHPLLVDKSVAVKILMSGAEVHEFIPKTKQTVKLTLGNINNPNRYCTTDNKVTEPSTPVAPVVRNGVPNITTHVVEPVVEVVVEEATSAPVVEEASQEGSLITFEYNEDGTVDENKIEWSKYSKNQRKEIRAQITQHNASIAK